MAVEDRGQYHCPPYLSSVTLRNVEPFRNGACFRFDPKANVLVGPNGLGKSTALRAFAGLGQSRFVVAPGQPQGIVERWTTPDDGFGDITAVYVGPTRVALDPDTVLQDLHQFDIEEKSLRILDIVRRVALAMMGATFFFMIAMLIGKIFPGRLLSLDDFGDVGVAVFVIVVWLPILAHLLASWARRNLLRLIPDGWLLPSMFAHDSEVSSVFMFKAVQIANRRLLGRGNSRAEGPRAEAAVQAAELAHRCAKMIAPEAYPASSMLHTARITARNGSERKGWLSFLAKKSYVDHLANVDTRYHAKPLHVADLSSGTQGPLLIAWYLALRMVYSNGFQPGWEKQPAILFIDEIENHLHPMWQRRVIPAFLEHFPNLQIFATAHTPFAIAGLKVGQIHKLLRDEDGFVVAETNDYDVVGWTADEILHDFLEVADPTDLDTARAVEILNWLEELDELFDERSAESWRLAEVDHLDGLVGIDGAGPAETVVVQWLKGEIENPVGLNLPLVGDAEPWRISMVAEFRSVIGVDVLLGGPAARQRQMRAEEDAVGTARGAYC